jgi:epoxide hydrolase-like predicted phosphatase
VIKAVIFDFFGVICSDEYWQFVKQDRQSDNLFRDYTDEVNLGDIPWQAFVQKVAEATNTSVEEVNRMYETEKIDPRMIGLVHELHKTYKTALLTNAHHDFIDGILAEHKISPMFDEVVVSSRLGIVKPNPMIFEYALERLGVGAYEAVYIDDLERHAGAAKELGMHTILFEDFEQCKQELDAILSGS